MPAQHLDHLGLRWSGVAREEIGERHEDAGGAEPALQRVIVLERLLQRVELAAAVGERFHGGHRPALGLHRKRQARAHRSAVDQHRAAAADAVLAADMGAGGAEDLAEEIAQQHARLGLAGKLAAVERQRDPGALVLAYAAHRIASCDHDRADPAQEVAPHAGRGMDVVVAFELPGDALDGVFGGAVAVSLDAADGGTSGHAADADPDAAGALDRGGDRHDGEIAVAARDLAERHAARSGDRETDGGDQLVAARARSPACPAGTRRPGARACPLSSAAPPRLRAPRAPAEFPTPGRRGRPSRRPCPCCGSGSGRRRAAPPPAAAASAQVRASPATGSASPRRRPRSCRRLRGSRRARRCG